MPPLRPELFTPSPAAHNAEYSQLSSLTSPLLCLYSLSKMIQNEASHTCVNNAQMSNFILEVSSKIHISISNYPLKIFTKEFLSSTSNLLFLVGGHSSLLTVEYQQHSVKQSVSKWCRLYLREHTTSNHFVFSAALQSEAITIPLSYFYILSLSLWQKPTPQQLV